jgi:hypothetical protein
MTSHNIAKIKNNERLLKRNPKGKEQKRKYGNKLMTDNDQIRLKTIK